MILYTRISEEERAKLPPLPEDAKAFIEETKNWLSPADYYFDEKLKKWLPYDEDDFGHDDEDDGGI